MDRRPTRRAQAGIPRWRAARGHCVIRIPSLFFAAHVNKTGPSSSEGPQELSRRHPARAEECIIQLLRRGSSNGRGGVSPFNGHGNHLNPVVARARVPSERLDMHTGMANK